MSENTEKDLQDAAVQESEDELTAQAEEAAADAAEAPAAEEEAEFSLEDYMRQYKELEAEQAKLMEEKEQLDARFLRLQADFDNFRRRSRADNEEASRKAAAAVAEGLLPVLDNFERALAAMEDTADREGVELIMKQLQTALA
ncbi:MAG: nucleotide exchange factor GrpE, partial [Firmicutes bacterium]|nr:nucleotide exchange factor GrpE [Bacillota bacterium]